MSDLHRQIFVAEYSALRAAGIQPQYAIPRAWETVELLATSLVDKSAEAMGRPGPLRELAELHEHAAKCERLLARARGVMRGELELTQREFDELLGEIGEAIDEPEVER